MAKHSRALHFKTGSTTDDVTLYTTLGEVVDPTLINEDQTTGGASLYTTGADAGYPALRVQDGNDTVFGALVSPSDMRATNLKVRHNDTTYAVATTSSMESYGICYYQENNVWVWKRVDEAGNPLTTNPNFATIAPWSGIETVTIDGNIMVKIPKFYVKAGTITSGTYAGAKARWVCPMQKDGYHIHPAFVRNGFVMDCIYIGAYEASLDANGYAASVYGVDPTWYKLTGGGNEMWTAKEKPGWRFQGIYDIAAINYLLLIELGTPDAQNAIGRGNVDTGTIKVTGSTNAVWRGIHEWWGNAGCWISDVPLLSVGGGTTTAKFNFPSNQGDNLGIAYNYPAENEKYFNGLSDYHVTRLDMNDLFIPSEFTDDISISLIPDAQGIKLSNNGSSAVWWCMIHGNCPNERVASKYGTMQGPFALGRVVCGTPSWNDPEFARIAKDGTVTDEAAPNR